MEHQIGQDVWLAVVGLLFTVIQSLVGLVVGYLIFEIKKLNKLISETTSELIQVKSAMWSKDTLDSFFELNIRRHKDECSRCAVNCTNYSIYGPKNKEDNKK